MKIIVSGAAGFIGSNLSKALVNDGHQVTGIDNFSYGSKQNIQDLAGNSNFQLIEADLNDPRTLDTVQGDILVHLASQKIPRYSSALKTLEENSNLTKNAVTKCLSDNIKLVFASTSDVYGKNPELPYHEESNMLLGPTTVKRWAYASSKIHSELYIIANADEHDLKYTICRFFGSYGPNQNLTWWGGPQSVFIGKAMNNETIEVHGDGLQTRTFTYVEDTVQGICKCMFEPAAENEIFNIANEPYEEIAIKDLAILIWEMVRGAESEPKIKLIPYSTFGKYEDVMRRVPSISKIKDQLGFVPKFPLTEGMKRTIEWQKALQ